MVVTVLVPLFGNGRHTTIPGTYSLYCVLQEILHRAFGGGGGGGLGERLDNMNGAKNLWCSTQYSSAILSIQTRMDGP